MTTAVIALHAGVALAIHLVYERSAPAALDAPLGPAAPLRPGAGAAGASASDPSRPDPPEPAPTAGELERTVSDCVERSMKAGTALAADATVRGRWPAIKKAREQQRQRRIAARLACEQQPRR